MKVTCKNDTKMYASGAQIPVLLTISLISSLVKSVSPNALNIKYIPSTKAIITTSDINNLIIDFFASLDNGLIVSLLFILIYQLNYIT